MIGIKEFNKKITSLKNTKKMTKTMKMVSASKFKKAHKAQSSALSYARELTSMMSRLSKTDAQLDHPLMVKPKTVSNVLIVLITSDKGLCGGFNNNLVRYIRAWVNENGAKYKNISFSFCGKRGYMLMRRSATVVKNYEEVTAKPTFAHAITIGADLAKAYETRQFDEIYLAYNHFNSAMSQVPVIEKLIPFDSTVIKQEKAATQNVDYIFEPEPAELFQFLVPKYLNFKIFFSLLENAAGEHGARMTAMDKATENTGELINKYILLRNRARQAAITTELIEIISGAEALKN
ncbi:MAG: ATP synthase F1 subunit gamma [Candidatus Omnitrophica bacterium]|nr:ATP synthase F1 subunit gamma [Candidatus Omnitrophota bacterium]